ncbi:PEP-CTERM sorting domain-containing protein, partial [bacterium]|nr:PEP-CTERM sorting domain-containing protein [bacterium]
VLDRIFRDEIQSTDEFFLMSAGGALTGSFSNVLSGGFVATEDSLSRFTVYYGPSSLYDPGTLVLTNFLAIPEPASLSLLALGALMLRRRRRG